MAPPFKKSGNKAGQSRSSVGENAAARAGKKFYPPKGKAAAPRYRDEAAAMGYEDKPRRNPNGKQVPRDGQATRTGQTGRAKPRPHQHPEAAEPALRPQKPARLLPRPFKPAATNPNPVVSAGVRVARPAAERTAHVAREPHRYGQLLHGMHAVREAWLNPQRRCRQLWLTPAAAAEFAPTLALAAERNLPRPAPLSADRAALDALLPGAIHQGIALDADALPELTLNDLLAKQPKLLLVLDQVTDPHNVGAMLRSAAAFGADAVLLTERHAPGQTGTLAKSASGALEHVPLVPVVNLARALEQLREAGFWCIGLAEEGEKALGAHDLSGATALVLGAEGDGLRRLTRERCDALAHLPTQGAIGSLNVSNAAAIALYEARRQRD